MHTGKLRRPAPISWKVVLASSPCDCSSRSCAYALQARPQRRQPIPDVWCTRADAPDATAATAAAASWVPQSSTRVPARTDEELTTVIRQGLPTAGMPASPGLSDAEVTDVLRFLRSLRPREGSGPVRTTIALSNGRSIQGLVLNQGPVDLQLLGDDRKIHLLRKSGDRYRQVTSQTDWPSYNGQTAGSRYSQLTQINKSNVGRLTPKWTFSLPNTPPLQVTPVVVDGVMYVTSANQCYALDAGSGRRIWHYSRPRTKRAHRQRGRRCQPRRRRRRRSRVHGDRSRAHHRAQPLRPARCCGKRRWRTGGRTTTPRALRS